MATNTTNLNLIKPAGSERVQISQINQNMDILDEKIGAVGNTSVQSQIDSLKSISHQVYITNQYSTVLDAINAYASTCAFPFTIQKSGASAYTDIPTGVTNTCEWNAICIGTPMRITVILVIFTGASSNNQTVWEENIYNGSINQSWQQITKGDTDASKTTVTIGSSTVVYRKVNGVVHVRVRYDAGADGAISSWTNKTLTVLPTGYRPAVELTVRGCCDREPSSKAATITITEAGTCRVEARWQDIAGTSGDILYANFEYFGI